MILFNNDPELANQLLNAMVKWTDENAESDLSAKAQAFKDWVGERRELAQLTQAYSRQPSHW